MQERAVHTAKGFRGSSKTSWHDTKVADGSLPPLHPWNHAPRELPASSFDALRTWWAASLKAQHSHIADALSGRGMDVLQQCVAINMDAEGTALSVINDAQSLAEWLHSLHAERCTGGATETFSAALLTGPPAAGKTSLLSQVVVHSLHSKLVAPTVNTVSGDYRIVPVRSIAGEMLAAPFGVPHRMNE